MTKSVNTFFAIGMALLVSGAAVAQQGQQQSPTEGKPQMSMDGMMKGCRDHCQRTSASMKSLAQSIEQAKQSNDPAKMRAALDQAQKPLNDMTEHMSMCMNMMDMMERMHGKGGKEGMGGMMSGGHMGMMQGQQELKFAASVAELDKLCGTRPDPKTAPRATYQGRTYYFCSDDDRAAFQKNPAKYVK